MRKRFWSSFLGNKPKGSRYTGLNIPLSEYFAEIGSLSDVGIARSNNQDSIGLARFSDNRNFLAVVADGMGGHQGGQVASQTAVNALQQNFTNQLTNKNYVQALTNGFAEANKVVYQMAQNSLELIGMGTTLVALAVIDGCAYYANTGDSRLYLLRGKDFNQLSVDHTLVAEMVKGGLITPEAAETHSEKHVITSAIGTKLNFKVESSKYPYPINIGDCFLLCSDGLYDLVKDVEIVQILNNHPPQEASKQLVDLANRLGGYDNISVIIIKIVEKPTVFKESPVTRA